MENFLKNFVLIFFPKNVAKVVLFSMPKQVKEKAKMWDFACLEAARFARSEQAGNPLFEVVLHLIMYHRSDILKLIL